MSAILMLSIPMAYSKPGETRKKVLAFMRERILAGSPPTVREVQNAFSFRSVQTARGHLEALVREGRLRKEPRKSRGYRLAGRGLGKQVRFVPLLGRVQAGDLTYAEEELEGYLSTGSRFPGEELFALRVRGQSMQDAGILPGDIVVVRKQTTADPGDIVVALVEDEATVKRFAVRNGRVELHPENPDFEPMVPDPRHLKILGRVVEVRRTF
jgi:repressor LexA